MNDIIKKLEQVVASYNNATTEIGKRSFSKLIKDLKTDAISLAEISEDNISIAKIEEIVDNVPLSNSSLIDTEIIEEKNNVENLEVSDSWWKRNRNTACAVVATGLLIAGLWSIAPKAETKNVDYVQTDKINDKEQLNVFDEVSIENRGIEFAKFLAEYGQKDGFTADDFTYLGLLSIGEMPNGNTAKKFDLGNMMSEKEAKKTGEKLWSALNNATMYGIKEEDKSKLVNLFENDMDKKVVAELMDNYYNVMKNPTPENKASWTKFLDNYLNNYHVRTSDLFNVGFLTPAVDSVNNYYPEFQDRTDAIITSIKRGAESVENSSTYSESRKEFNDIYKDIIAQEKYAKEDGKTELDKTGQEISDSISKKLESIVNKDLDIPAAVKEKMLNSYDNTPEEQARLKMGPNDQIKTDSNGQPYIPGGSSSEDLSDQKLPNKDANGNETNESKDDMINMSNKAVEDFNNNQYKNIGLYNSNASYKNTWDQCKKAYDEAMNNANQGLDKPTTEEKEETEAVKPAPPAPSAPAPEPTPNPDTGLSEDLPTVPDDYVPPKPGDKVEEEVKEETVPLNENINELKQLVSDIKVELGSDGNWQQVDDIDSVKAK